jgi:hypothetical protein
MAVLRTGWSLEYAMSMDVLTFNAFISRMVKVHYREKAQDLWASASAAQAGFTGEQAGLKKLTNAWIGKKNQGGNDLARDLRQGMLKK